MTTPPSPQSPRPAQGKVCIRCGLDCSSRPRVKDLQGRYTCRDCYDAMQNEPAVVLSPAPTKRAEHRIEPAPEDPAAGADEGIYALMLEDAVQAQSRITTSPCPGCGHPLAADAAICTTCGYNTRTGQAVTTRKASASDPDIAPGDDPLVKASRQERRRQKTLTTQMEYIKPLIYMVVGLGITCTLLMNRGGTDDVARYLLAYSISIPCAVAGFCFCCILWLGFDAPLPLTAVRLAGIYAIADIFFYGLSFRYLALLGFIGLGVRFVVPVVVSAGLMMHLMDMDHEDAMIASVITFIIRFVGMLALAALLANQLSGG